MKKIFITMITIITIFTSLNANKDIKKDRFVSMFLSHTLFINIRKIERIDDSLIIHFGNGNKEWTIPYSDFSAENASDKLLFFSLSQREVNDILEKLQGHKKIVIDFDALTKTYY